MATEKQTAANRLNAQKSTGPRTPEGRAAVRLNGVTHGLTAKTLVLKGESEDDFKALFEFLEEEHQPASPTEEILVADLAMATWRRRRLYNMEAGFYNVRLERIADYADGKNFDDSCRLGKLADNSGDTMAMIGRQEARLERTYYKALHELQRLRKEREAKLALLSPAPAGQAHAHVPDKPSPAKPVDAPIIAPEIPTPPHRIMRDPAPPASPPNL
jgi:hypothetical protein